MTSNNIKKVETKEKEKTMKLIHYINTALLLCVVNLFWSCDEDESNLSKAVLTSASALNFGANGAAEQVITVYADAEWVMEKLPE